jgi:hypothetical protein
LVNVAEQSKFVVAALRLAKHLSFRALVQDAEEPMVVVARFLALLDLYRTGITFASNSWKLLRIYRSVGSVQKVAKSQFLRSLMCPLPSRRQENE